MKLHLVFGCALLAAAAPAHAKGLTVDDMLAMQRISDPAVSPDGKWVAFSVRDTDYDANRGRMDVWVASVDGATVRRVTTHPENDSDARWSPDGRYLYFMSTRSGSSQVWRIAAQGGGEAEQVTRLPIDLNGFRLFPDGKRLVVAMDVYPDAKTLDETIKRDDAKARSKVKARVYDQLLFRHWDTWEDGKYSHLFVWSPERPNAAIDITPGQTTDSPTHPFGGMEEVSISPDGKTIAFVARQGGRETAWHTNTDVFLVPAAGGAKPVALTAANKAYDFEPSFSPDGRSIAVRRMARPGYEADRERIGIYDVATRKERILTEAWDRSASSIAWAPDGKTIYTSADNVGNHSLFAIDVATGKEKLLLDKGTNNSPRIAGDRLVFLRDTLKAPAELFSMKLDGSDLRPITKLNAARVARIQFGDYEQF
ncbi:MAG TPA: S9 family peptidase, partial [Kofleriaceae bacterium]|nr:S9 family peptidase [Kofleriaceae bacterium]